MLLEGKLAFASAKLTAAAKTSPMGKYISVVVRVRESDDT